MGHVILLRRTNTPLGNLPPPPLTRAPGYVGVNALDFGDVTAYGSTEQPFLNLLKQSGSNYSYIGCPWWTRTAAGADTNEENVLASALLDADGYPTGFGALTATVLETWVNMNIIADTPLPGAPASGNALFPAAAAPVVYRLQFQGKCTLNITGATNLSTSTGGVTVVGSQITSTNAWPTVNTVLFTVSQGFRLQITALPDNNNYFRAASIVDNTLASSYDAGEILHPLFKSFISGGGATFGFSRLRAMVGLRTNNQDINFVFNANLNIGAISGTFAVNGVNNGTGPWSNWPFPSTSSLLVVFSSGDVRTCTVTNGNNTLTWTGGLSAACNTNAVVAGRGCMASAALYSWASRPKVSNMSWGVNALPFEAIIQACNELNQDLWLNIPATAPIVDGSFINNLASLLNNGTGAAISGWNVASFSGLSTALATYVEYTNEASGNWNGGAGYLQSGNVLALKAVQNGLYAANGNNLGYSSSEYYGVQVATIANTFASVFGGSFAARVKVRVMTQFATGNGVSFLQQAMNTPHAVGLGLLTTPAYQNGISGWGFAPYMPLSNSIASLSTADQSALFLLSAAAQITEIFSLAYGNTGASGHVYSSWNSAGWVGQAFGANGVSGMLAGAAGQPWASYAVDCYEAGINADQVGGIPGSNYTLVQFQSLMTGVLRDPRIASVYYDPGAQLSSNPGYLQTLKNLSITVNHLNGVAPTAVAAPWAGWGVIEEIMQMVGLQSSPSIVPRYQGIIAFALQSGATQQVVKFNPGNYSSSNSFIQSQGAGKTSQGVVKQTEINQTLACTGTTGYRMYITWGALTQDGVTFDFSSITNTLTQFRAANPQRRLVVCLMSGSFSGQDMPQYITTNAVYGNSSVAGKFGFWGSCAAIHRPLVLAEYIKVWQAMLSFFDGEPLFEMGLHQEDSFWVSQLEGAGDWDSTGVKFESACEQLLAACIASAPHTSVSFQGTFQAASQSLSNKLATYMYNGRVLPGETDTYGYSDANRPPSNFAKVSVPGWSWGLSYYLLNYRGLTACTCDVEAYDLGASYGSPLRNNADNALGYTASDILQSINLNYQATHAFWAILGAGDNVGGAASGALKTQLQANAWGTVGSGGLSDFLANSANKITNTLYPANYPPAKTKVVNLTLTSSISANTAWTFGQPFKQGDVPAGSKVVALSGVSAFQADARNFWPDGSVKVAVLSGISPLTANTAATIVVGKQAGGSAASNVAEPTAAQVSNVKLVFTTVATTYSIASAVTCALSSVVGIWQGGGAAPVWNAANGGKVRQILGPVMSEFHYYQPVNSLIHVWWYVRAYSNGAIEVERVIENGWWPPSTVVNTQQDYGIASYTASGIPDFQQTVLGYLWPLDTNNSPSALSQGLQCKFYTCPTTGEMFIVGGVAGSSSTGGLPAVNASFSINGIGATLYKVTATRTNGQGAPPWSNATNYAVNQFVSLANFSYQAAQASGPGNGGAQSPTGTAASNAFWTNLPTAGNVGWLTCGGNTLPLSTPASQTITSAFLCGHFPWTRWTRVDWIGGNPVTPAHDPTYLINTKMVPNYAWRSPSVQAQTQWAAPASGVKPLYTKLNPLPYDLGMETPDMGNTGYHPDIGLLPLPAALYCTSALPNAYLATIGMARVYGRWAMYARDVTTGHPIIYSTYPNSEIPAHVVDVVSGVVNGTSYPAAPGSNTGTFDVAHHPSYGYLPYLIEGRWSFMEQQQFAASYVTLYPTGTNPGGLSSGIVAAAGVQSTRGVGWAWRSMLQAMAIAPRFLGGTAIAMADAATSALLAAHQNAWVATANHHLTTYVQSSGARYNTLGLLGSWGSEGTGAQGVNWGNAPFALWVAPWMTNYQTMPLCHGAEIIPWESTDTVSSGLTILQQLAAYSCLNAIQMSGNNTGFNYRYGVDTYAMPIAPCTSIAQVNSVSDPWLSGITPLLTIQQRYSNYLTSIGLPAQTDASGGTLFEQLTQTPLSPTVGPSFMSVGNTAFTIDCLALAVDLEAAGLMGPWESILIGNPTGALAAFQLVTAASNYNPNIGTSQPQQNDQPLWAIWPRTQPLP